MLEPTRKPPIDTVELYVAGPANKRDEAMRRLQELGFQAVAPDAVPWREVLTYKDEELPGVYLAGARYREGLTQEALSKATGIPRRHISEMENHKRPMGKQNARKLAEALHIDPRRLLAV